MENSTTNLPLEGIRVLEVASWVMIPSAGAILAAYGAEVVKIEPSGSADPSRAFTVEIENEQIEPGFELSNAGKRSITLNLNTDTGQEVLHRLIARSDVFLTNIRAASLERAELTPALLHDRYPTLVIAHGTGYGLDGPDAGRPAFDELAYWGRGGIGRALAPKDDPPVQLVGAMGDLPSGVAVVAGVMTALFRREREGIGSIVDVSLYGAGLWSNGWEVQTALLGKSSRETMRREHRVNPLYNCYRCADGTWIQFAMHQAGRYWPLVCTALERPDLVDNPRFRDFDSILENAYEATQILDSTIGEINLEELQPRLDAADLPWAPIMSLEDIATDDQARVNGMIRTKKHRSGLDIDSIAPPFQLRDQPPRLEPSPAVGQHREELLIELGYEWDEIVELGKTGAF